MTEGVSGSMRFGCPFRLALATVLQASLGALPARAQVSGAPPVHVIAPGHENEVLRFLKPLEMGKPITDSCGLANVNILPDGIALQVNCGGKPGTVSLKYPGAESGGVPAGPVDLFPGPALPTALVATLVQSLKTGEHGSLPWAGATDTIRTEATPGPELEYRRLLVQPHAHRADVPRAALPPLLLALIVLTGTGAALSSRFRAWLQLSLTSRRRELAEAWTDQQGLVTFALIALMVGAALRLAYPGTIEYKNDEGGHAQYIENMWRGAPLPLHALGSSIGLPSPPLCVWVLIALSRLTGADDPPAMSRSVALLNITALALLLFHAVRLGAEERRVWLWTGALAAVNPIGMITQRKLAPASILPFFALLLFIAWGARRSRWGAFWWGVLGGAIGQIHMIGFVVSGVLFLSTAVPALRSRQARDTRWWPWLAGSALAGLPLIPWARVWGLYREPTRGFEGWHPANSLRPVLAWIQDALGGDLSIVFGLSRFQAFGTFPTIGGVPTYAAGIAMVMSVVAAGLIAAAGLARLVRRSSPYGQLRPTWVLHNTEWLGFCGIMAFWPFAFWPHYLVPLFPLENMTLPLLSAGGRRSTLLLGLLWGSQLIVATSLLVFLHLNQGAPGEGFGISYEQQLVLLNH